MSARQLNENFEMLCLCYTRGLGKEKGVSA